MSVDDIRFGGGENDKELLTGFEFPFRIIRMLSQLKILDADKGSGYITSGIILYTTWLFTLEWLMFCYTSAYEIEKNDVLDIIVYVYAY